MLLSDTLAAVAIPGAGLVLSIGAVAVSYGIHRARTDATAKSVETLATDLRIEVREINRRLTGMDEKIGDVGRDVARIEGALSNMRTIE